MKDQLKLSGLMRPHWRWWLLSLALGALTLASIMGLLTVSGWFITASALAGLQLASAGSFNYFGPAALIRFFAISRTASRYFERLSSHNAILLLLQQLRLWFMRRFLASSVQPDTKSADLLQKLITDIDRLDQWPLRVVAPVFWACLISSGWLTALWFWQSELAQVALAYLCALLLVPACGVAFGYRRACSLVELASQRRQELLEPLSALTMLQLHQGWTASEQQWQQTELQYQDLLWRQQVLDLCCQFLLFSGLALMSFHLLITALPLAAGQQISIAALVAMLMSTLALTELWLPLATLYRHLAESAMAKQRLNHIQPEAQAGTCTQLTGPLRLELQQLYAAYPGALQQTELVNCSLKAGDLLWLQGPSGVGKSALLSTLAGWLPPLSGQILLNGMELQLYTASTQRQHISLLSQQVSLFNMTLAANLRLANPEASDEDLRQSLAEAQLGDWLATLPLGLETELGEYGVAVSGGQARRIALARLLLQNSSILLLDEPLVGLDPDTAHQLIQTLRRRCQQQILIIASHQSLAIDPDYYQLHLKLL
ncbi:amino acid ABC transporter ATP-binding/permease protein [Rheinheimera sp. MM224]|uniref:amino acid ABC transporter ATP-binding/permease protein n=1 Tax=Rheinheimera sp. MM224 TaxID=3019969 RepID=UPI0021F8AB52|nr:ATP-binding cassette domain-containing protein [Rheinheimera sp. MM224]CAI3794214.1 putative ABC transporter ATP-binding/permease protein [Rheinheimera sp. MM224]